MKAVPASRPGPSPTPWLGAAHLCCGRAYPQFRGWAHQPEVGLRGEARPPQACRQQASDRCQARTGVHHPRQVLGQEYLHRGGDVPRRASEAQASAQEITSMWPCAFVSSTSGSCPGARREFGTPSSSERSDSRAEAINPDGAVWGSSTEGVSYNIAPKSDGSEARMVPMKPWPCCCRSCKSSSVVSCAS
jgi:hypothetical protein